MTDFIQRLTRDLEPVLLLQDPSQKISAYHDMPYAIFRYDPNEELQLRIAVSGLQTRLENKGKRVTKISLADCLTRALQTEAELEDWFELEKQFGAAKAVEDIHSLLAERAPLVDMVADLMPDDPDPKRDVALIVRTGALFPVYRTFSLLEQLKGRVTVPTILFYPGELDGAAGLRFMGVLNAEHNYRPKIF
ncbi:MULTISPECIES: BREX protein BrxB domain-containing protein [unclassified Rhizobium]|uniref:BREX protein BrxB domain-containing protein n=1 Tax=unclassified Rhizobium TaxID=2613769 RepID=UPI00288AE6BC|nr:MULTISPECIES: BREX protein BrxB domain-containing protein [unclassified Rhizobium]